MEELLQRENPTEACNAQIKREDTEVPCCEGVHHHDALIEDLKVHTPQAEILYDLAELYKVFGDTTRIRILYLLFEAELCVCDIAQFLQMTQSAISHQLRVLKQAKLVKFRKEGKTVFYSLADEHVRSIINQGMEHLNESQSKER